MNPAGELDEENLPFLARGKVQKRWAGPGQTPENSQNSVCLENYLSTIDMPVGFMRSLDEP